MERARVRVKKIDENSILETKKILNKRAAGSTLKKPGDNKRVVLKTVKQENSQDNVRSNLLSKPRSIQVYQDEVDEIEEQQQHQLQLQQQLQKQQQPPVLHDVEQDDTPMPNSDDTIEQESCDEDVEVDEEEEEDDDDDDDEFTKQSPSPSLTNPNALYPVYDKTSHQYMTKLKHEFSNKPGIWDDEDEDTLDVSMVTEYSDDIFVYMRKLEQTMRPDPGYMDNQTEIHWSMRSILVDWLVQVHARFNLLPETLFLTINYMDRFLSLKTVSLSKFQLVGAVALFVAAKYEEINCPSVQEIAYMVDHGYSIDEILKAERYMIDLLEFNLGWPGPMSFLRRTSKADDYDLETRTLAKYLLEISIMDERFVASPPSWLAASAHCLARQMLNRGGWTKDHAYFGGYTQAQLEPAVKALLACCENPMEHHKAIYEKYADKRFKRASIYVAEWMKEHYF